MTPRKQHSGGGVQKIDYSEATQMLRSGKTQREVADHFGVTQAAVSANIKRGNIKIEYPNQTEGRSVPWHPILPEHRDRYLIRMLRANHRREQGLANAPVLEAMLDKFLVAAEEQDFVVTYDPDTEEGFFRVPRRVGIDEGLIRNPDLDDEGRPLRKLQVMPLTR
ncbi:MAG TPA: hypothetical protein VK204_17110 [Nocardioidaceae bacterium]|nr:hypothetical protein [Nocardioidaceae bacterium]